MDAFLAGLNDQIATRILEMFPGPRSLFALQTIASRIDSRLSTHNQFFRTNNNFNNKSSNSHSNSFRFFQNKSHEILTPEEKERRRKENLCFYCGSKDHQVNNCPLKNNQNNNQPSSSNTFISNSESKQAKSRPRLSDNPSLNAPVAEFSLQVSNSSCKAKLLLDSGSQLNLILLFLELLAFKQFLVKLFL